MTFNPRYTDPSRFNNRHEYEAYQNHADTELSHAIREILNFREISGAILILIGIILYQLQKKIKSTV